MTEIEKIKALLIKYPVIVPYLIFGVLTTIINLGVYALLYSFLGVSNVLSTVVSWTAAVVFSFVTSKRYVFGSTSWDRLVVLAEFNKFMAVRIGTGVFEVILMYISVDLLGFNGLLMKIIVNIFVVITNYLASKLMIFKNG